MVDGRTGAAAAGPPAPGEPSLRHLLGRLAVVHARVRAAVASRRAEDGGPDPFRGLYLAEDQVDRLLAPPGPNGPPDPAARTLLTEVEQAAQEAEEGGAVLRLRALSRAFGLTPLDVDLLIVALAPDTDRRFEGLYGYLHDDVTRRRASVGLALELAGAPALSAAARARLMPGGPLIDGGLIEMTDLDRPFLTRALTVPDRVLVHLLGGETTDPELGPLVRPGLPCPSDGARALAASLRGGAALCYLQERRGGSAAPLAAAALADAGLPALVIDLDGLGARDPAAVAAAAGREARLRGAGLVVGPLEALGDRAAEAVGALSGPAWPVLLYGRRAWDPAWSTRVPLCLNAPAPAAADSAALWATLLDGEVEPGLDLTAAVAPVGLSPLQITRAADAAWWQARHAGRPVGLAELRTGARSQNAVGLERLARRTEPRVGWADLVLPDRQRRHLRELESRARFRRRVLEDWGMAEGGGRGGGIAALFAGPSGTGKTMAAEVLAHELGCDLYTVDLSTVVDKYIGETEKNLERIFGEAERVNGVLFFDEADALFGKRSDVRDAHDRYANVETAYLLQRMEAFDGVAILATNLGGNLDEAFSRRLDAIIDFPVPDAEHRLRIWERALRPGVPRGEDLDLGLLADRFDLSGGNIRNVALAASYFAAAEDRPVSMADLMRGVNREFLKLGRLFQESDFEPYQRWAV
ncbi:ATP-binding protein [Kitasatospora paracochleata]